MRSARARIAMLTLSTVLTLTVPIGAGASAVGASVADHTTTSACAEAEEAMASTRGIPIRLCGSIPAAPDSSVGATPPIPVSAGPCQSDLEKCEAWVSDPYDGPAKGWDFVGQRLDATGNLAGNALATTMDGKRVFTAGASERVDGQWAVATLAYDATDGKRLWEETLEPAGAATELSAVSVVAGDDAVFVTGYALEGGEGIGFTRAYEAETGATLWHRTFPGWANHSAISEDGTRIFVAGDARLKNGDWEGRVVSYDAATGEQVWLQSMTEGKRWLVMPWRIASRGDRVSVAVSRMVPDGPELGVTKSVIVATYDATGPDEGALVSTATASLEGALPAGIALSAGGSKAFVPVSVGASLSGDAPTYVFGVDTAAGDLIWSHYFLGWPWNGELPTATYPWHFHPIEVSPRGSVILSTYSRPYLSAPTFVTASLNPDTGYEEWRAFELAADHDQSPPGQSGPTVSVNPKTGQVVVTGAMYVGARLRPVTFGYSSTGQREWMRISNEPPKDASVPALSEGIWSALAHSPDGSRVFGAGFTSAVYNDPASSPDVIVAAFDTAA